MIPLPSGTRPAAWHDRSMTSQKRAQTGKGTPGSFAPAGTAGNADTVAARGYGTEPEPLACDYWEENHVPDDARTQWDEVMRQLTPESGMSPRTNLTAMTVRDTWSKDGVSAGANAVIVSRAGIRPPFGVGMNGMNVEPIPADSPYPQGPFKDTPPPASARGSQTYTRPSGSNRLIGQWNSPKRTTTGGCRTDPNAPNSSVGSQHSAKPTTSNVTGSWQQQRQ